MASPQYSDIGSNTSLDAAMLLFFFKRRLTFKSVVVQSLSCAQLFAALWTTARQASLSSLEFAQLRVH